MSRAETLANVLADGSSGPVESPAAPRVPLHSKEPVTFDAFRTPQGELLSATGGQLPEFALPDNLADPGGPGDQARGSLRIGETKYRVVSIPVERPDGRWLAVAGASKASNDEAVRDVARGLLVAVPVLILLVAAGTWLLARAALRPVERMRRDAVALSAQPGEGRLRVPETGDELAALAKTLNELLERLRRSLARQRSLVSDAGHELRTPLAVLRTELELADRPGRSREELAEAVGHAAVEADRLSQLADDLLFLARADEGEPLVRPQPTDVAALLTSAARTFRSRADELGVVLTVDVPDELPALADPAALRRAIDNVLSNALEHTRTGGGVRLAPLTLEPRDRATRGPVPLRGTP